MFKKHIFPFFVLIIFTLFFYRQYFFNHQLPIPTDILPGMYLPWMDSYGANIPVKNSLPSDIVSLTYPLRLLSITILKQGFWPLYNPQILSGTPLLANIQSAALYPLNFLYFLSSSFADIWSWQVILQLVLAFIFTYFFLKSYQLNTISSIFGAIAWSTGGFFSLWSQYNTVIHAIIYLPLALLSLKNFSSNSLWGISLSLSITFSLLAGNPPLTLILLFSLLIYFFLLNRFNFKSYLKLLPFAFLTILLSAPLLLPSLDVSNHSIRKYDQVAINNDIKTIPISKIITLTTPDFFGNPATLNQWGDGSLYDNLTIFQGCVLLFLAFYALLLKFPKEQNLLKKYSIILAILSLVLITSNPISSFLSNTSLFGLNSMVFTRFHTLLNFSVTILASLVFNYFIQSKISKFKLFPSILIFIQSLIPITVYTLIFLINLKLIQTSYHPNFEPFDHSILERNFLVSLRNTAIPLVISFFILISSVILKFIPKLTKIFLGLLFLLMVLENYNFFRKYNTFTKPEYLFQPTKITEYLKNNGNRFARETGEIIPSNTWMPYGLNSASGYDTLHSLKYNQFISLLNGGSLKNVTNRYLEIERPTSKLINFLAIDNYLAIKRDKNYRLDSQGKPRPEILENKSLTPVFEDGRTIILKNNQSMPFFFSVDNFLVSQNIETTEKLIKDSDLSTTVILDQNPPSTTLSKAEISSFSYQPNQYSLSTNSSKDSLIVASIVNDPSWVLTIDNQPSQILNANHAFISFLVPSGNHSIKLNYSPKLFYLGLKLNLLGILILFVFLAKTLYTKNQHRSSNNI